jgi:hypothetical protein
MYQGLVCPVVVTWGVLRTSTYGLWLFFSEAEFFDCRPRHAGGLLQRDDFCFKSEVTTVLDESTPTALAVIMAPCRSVL